MEITSEMSSLITDAQATFERNFKESLVTDSLRQVITKSMPASEVETKRLNDPDFRTKLNSILTPMTKEVIDKYENVSEFDTGNLFSSMVNSVADSVSLESKYRAETLFNDIQFDRVDEHNVSSIISERFKPLRFTNIEIGKRAVENFKFVLSTEDASDILEDIKGEVKDAIEETEDKNKLVEGTTKEIVDYKREIAPPDDKYDNPEETDDSSDTNGGETNETEPDNSDSSDDNQNTQQDATAADGQDGGEIPTGDETDMGSDTTDPSTTSDTQAVGADQQNNTTDETGTEIPANGDTTNDDVDDTSVDVNGEMATADKSATSGDPTMGGASTVTDPSADLENGDIPTGEDPNGGETQSSKSETVPSTTQNSGIVINITGADLAKAKESLSFKTAEKLAAETVPSHPKIFDEMKLPDKRKLASEACGVTGDFQKELEIQISSLRYGIRQISDAKSVESLMGKLNQLEETSTEAVHLSESMRKDLYSLGLSPEGLVNSKENTFFCAANLIKMLANTRHVGYRKPYTSVENVLTNAFDILQMRKAAKFCKGPVNPALANELISRESVFYKNIAAITDPKLVEQATAIINLTDMALEKALTTNFITDYKIKAWEVNVGKDANKNMNNEIIKRVSEKFEKLWGRKLNSDELEIVAAVSNNQDVMNIVPSPYEKFMVKLSKDLTERKSTESASVKFTPQEKQNIKFKAKLYTTLLKTCEKFNIVDTSDVYKMEAFYQGLY